MEKPAAIGRLTQQELDTELAKGMESLKSGKTYSIDEVNAELYEKFGI